MKRLTIIAAVLLSAAVLYGKPAAMLVLAKTGDPPTVSSATVNTTGDVLTVVFNETVTGDTGFSLDSSGGDSALTQTAGDGTSTHTFSIDTRVIQSGETVDLDYASGDFANNEGFGLEALTDFSVTNNSSQTGGTPEMTSATINADGDELTTVFDEAITGSTGITLSPSVGADLTPTYSSGSGTTSLVWSLDRTVSGAEVITLSYTQAAGNLLNGSMVELADITDSAVTNNANDAYPIPPATVDASLPSNISDAADHSPTNGTEFQADLDAAVDGDVIELSAGSTYSGNFVLPARAAGNGLPVIIRSSNYASLTAGTRVSPSDTSNMAKIECGTGQVWGIRAGDDADGYRFVGIEITKTNATNPTGLMRLGWNASSGMTTVAAMPDNIIIDRCYIHGHASNNTVRGVRFDCKNSAIIDSYFSDILHTTNDNQAISAISGGHTILIHNNYLEATGENIMLGGGNSENADTMPRDWTFTENYFFKPRTWDPNDGSYGGTDYEVKNLFELKVGLRVWAEGNVFENCWADDQSGVAWNIKSAGTASWTETRDVMMRLNKIIDVMGLIQLAGVVSSGGVTPDRIWMENNLCYDIGTDNGLTLNAAEMGGGMNYVTFRRNTIQADANCSRQCVLPGTVIGNMNFASNILPDSSYGFKRDGVASGKASVDAAWTAYTFTHNVLIDSVGTWTGIDSSNDLTIASETALKYTDAANDDFTLASDSPAKSNGVDGTDPGCDVSAVNTATSGVVP